MGDIKDLLRSGIQVDGKIIADILSALEEKANDYEREALSMRTKSYNCSSDKYEFYHGESRTMMNESRNCLSLAIEIKKMVSDALTKDKYAEITADDFKDISIDDFDFKNALMLENNQTDETHLSIALTIPDSLRDKLAEIHKDEVEITDNRCIMVRCPNGKPTTFGLFDGQGNFEVDVTELFTLYGIDDLAWDCKREVICGKRECTTLEKSMPNYTVLER